MIVGAYGTTVIEGKLKLSFVFRFSNQISILGDSKKNAALKQHIPELDFPVSLTTSSPTTTTAATTTREFPSTSASPLESTSILNDETFVGFETDAPAILTATEKQRPLIDQTTAETDESRGRWVYKPPPGVMGVPDKVFIHDDPSAQQPQYWVPQPQGPPPPPQGPLYGNEASTAANRIIRF